jgi:hypothetical protein
LNPDEEAALSHVPLVWMVREAERAGLHFDPKKVRALNCSPEESFPAAMRRKTIVPQIAIEPISPPASPPENATTNGNGLLSHAHLPGPSSADAIPAESPSNFQRLLEFAATKAPLHDVLQFSNGASPLSVLSWNIMEYLPFRRMDLQPNGTWKSIAWPLPKGEVRDIPDNVVIHNSVVRRMEFDEGYRPGNLIVGGGGRGVRKAPRELGMGSWRVEREEGDVVGECFVRVGRPAGSRRGTGLEKEKNKEKGSIESKMS